MEVVSAVDSARLIARGAVPLRALGQLMAAAEAAALDDAEGSAAEEEALRREAPCSAETCIEVADPEASEHASCGAITPANAHAFLCADLPPPHQRRWLSPAHARTKVF